MITELARLSSTDRKTQQVRGHLSQVRCGHQRDRKVDKQPTAQQTVRVRRPHHLRGYHGPRGGQEEAPGREDPWFFLLNYQNRNNCNLFQPWQASLASQV